MIVMQINGDVAYPDTSQNIKVTYENQFVKDSGSYTYEVQFPMAILENKMIFKNVDRFDVSKKLATYDDCKLYVDNRLVISGKGNVTNITNSVVKLQIVGGKSRIKYNSKFEQHYIDEIDYPSVVIDTGIKKSMYDNAGIGYPNLDNYQWMLFTDLTSANYVGMKGVAVLSPINDETNDIVANRPCLSKFDKIKINGVKFPSGTYTYMVDLAVSPYLMFVLKKVMDHEGYAIKRNDFDKDPWNRLVIVSACKSGKIKNALPHWTVYKFIDELRKFFNCSFIFDEVTKSVSIIDTNEMLTNDAVSYDCEDEFSVEYDEDGLDNMSTSNIEYSLDDAANRDWREYISQSVQKNYPTKSYATINAMVTDAEAMTTKERKTTIFKVGYNYYIWADLPKDGNPETEETSEQRTLCGLFNPIIRDMESDTFQELNIIPSAIYQRRLKSDSDSVFMKVGDKIGKAFVVMPSVTNEKEQSLEDMEVDEDGEYYYSVQDAMEGGTEDTSTTEDDSKLKLAFVANNVANLKLKDAVAYNDKLDGEDTNYRVPVLYTDYRMYPKTLLSSESGSMSLEALPSNKTSSGRSFGNLTTGKSRFEGMTVDKNNQICYKLLTDDIPDPSKIYILRNKKYICEKIEMNVGNKGIDKEKTGYFYAIV